MTKKSKPSNTPSNKSQNVKSIDNLMLSEDGTDSSGDEYFEEDDELDYEDNDEPISKDVVTTAKPLSENKHILELKESLGLGAYQQQVNAKAAKRKRQKERKRLKKALLKHGKPDHNTDFVETVASKMGKGDNIIPEIVEFKDPRKKSKEKQASAIKLSDTAKDDSKDTSTNEISMKEARFDVFKFGARGLDKKGQEDARTMLAISLGAKPEKNKCLPYEQYKEKKRIEKENEKKEAQMKKVAGLLKPSKRSHTSLKPRKGSSKTSKFQNSFSKSNNSKSFKKSKGGSKDTGGIQPKIGKFDGGMLKLSKQDIAKLKS